MSADEFLMDMHGHVRGAKMGQGQSTLRSTGDEWPREREEYAVDGRGGRDRRAGEALRRTVKESAKAMFRNLGEIEDEGEGGVRVG